jgi:hypothetical protein
MVRPERFELPTFWFVGERAGIAAAHDRHRVRKVCPHLYRRDIQRSILP